MVPAAFRPALDALDRRLDPASAAPLAVALSGGSDSTALLRIAKAWADSARRPLTVLTVDHGLHPDSAAWTQAVGEAARRLGVRWRALEWTGAKPTAGLSAAARQARHGLLADAVRDVGARVLLIGHTADDVAESELIRAETPTHGRLAEWSASPAWPQGRGVFILRPLLGLRRADLRAWLAAESVAWLDDPANTDPRFARSRARASLAGSALTGVSLQPAHLLLPCEAGEVARRNLRRDGGGVAAAAVSSLEAAAAATPPSPCCAWSPPPAAQGEIRGLAAYGVVQIDLARLLQTARPTDLLVKALSCVSGRSRPPAGAPLARLLGLLRDGETFTATLSGTRLRAEAGHLHLTRELGRSPPPPQPLPPGVAAVFDGRFELLAEAPGWRVAPLAGHAASLPRREHEALQAAPSGGRPALPVLLGPDGEVRLPTPLGTGPAHARCLVADRLAAAWGLVPTESTLQQAMERRHGCSAAPALILS